MVTTEKEAGRGWRDVLFEVIFEADTPAGKWFDIVLIICILLSVTTVMLDSVAEIAARHGPLLKDIEWFFTILIYPHTYAAKMVSTDGNITIEGRDVRFGESWQNGPVVLAWDSVTGGSVNITDARNVVLYEFAHQLDQEDGTSDGAPILEHRSSYIAWARVLGREYEALQIKKKKHKRSLMNKYGATNPAEFFAVATETFFEKAKQMKKKHPELYEELKDYYKLDPVEWG